MSARSRPASIGEMARGSAVMIAMRWSMRLIGLVSTMILARLLTPQDFGVVAMATVFVGFIELFSLLSFDLALIRIPEPSKAHYDTTWTLQALLGFGLSLLILGLAPLSAWYFEEPRLDLVVRVLSVNSLLQGLTNVGLVDFRREFRFRRDLQFNVYARLLTFVATMVAVLVQRNFWALVTGFVAGNVARLALSYIMHPYRPRLDLTHTREILSFSAWMLLFNVGNYLRSRLDTVVVGRITAAGEVGTYHVASELSAMPTNEVLVPTGRALFPAYSQLARDPVALRRTFRTVLAFFFTVVMAVCVGMMVVAPNLVRVVLGAQWVNAGPLVSILTFSGGFNGITHVIGTFHAANGRERFTAALTWLNVVMLGPALIFGVKIGGVPGIAALRGVVSAAVLVVALATVVWAGPLSSRDVFALSWRPTLSSAFMFASLATADLHLPSPGAELAAQVLLGASCFTIASYTLWWISGRPTGPEMLLVEQVQSWRKKRSAS